MAKIISYDISIPWKRVSDNENDISNIKKITAKPIDYSTIKKSQTLNLLNKFQLSTQNSGLGGEQSKYIWGYYDIIVIVPFDNIPIWALSGVSNHLLFYTGEDRIINPSEDSLIMRNFSHWQYKDKKYIYRTYIRFDCFDNNINNYIPVYVDYDILIQNPYNYINQSGYKS